MDFRTLTYFTVVARELNFTRAAEKLHMSQPPLSNQIAKLEEELGVQLFLRGKKQLRLTEAGTLLLRRSAQMLDIAEKTRIELGSLSAGLSGTLFLGMVEGMAPFLAAEWIRGFREEFPLVQFELWNGSSDDVLDQLSRGLADLAVIAAPFDAEHLDSIPVGKEPWVAMMSSGHPLAEQDGEPLPLAELVGQPLIVPRRKSRVEAIIEWFSEIDAEPTIICAQSNYIDALAMASANTGISIFPRTLKETPPGVVSRIITEPAKLAEYFLVWPREQNLSAVAEEFINFVRDTVTEEDSGVPENAVLL